MKGKDYNYRFTNTENKVYEYIISSLKQENEKGVVHYPDPKKMLISKFYNLTTEGYFKDIVIDDETIDKLMKNRKFSVAKKLFAKTKEDEDLFDRWAINKVEEF